MSARIRPEQILTAVSETYQLEPDSLRTPNRTSPYEDARRVLAHLLYVDAWLSWAGVAEFLGLSAGGTVQQSAGRAPAGMLAEVRKRYRTEGKAS